MPAGTVLQNQIVPLTPGEDEFLDPNTFGTLGTDPTATATDATATTADATAAPAAGQADAIAGVDNITAEQTGDIQDVTPAQAGTADIAQAGDVADVAQITTPTEDATATFDAALIEGAFAEGVVDPLSLPEVQLNSLLDFEGDEVPIWAKGAVLAAETLMAQRGLTRSTESAQAVAGAILQAALPIAFQNASVYEGMNLANLSNEQQALLSDQSFQNAALQFNASSLNQMTTFFAQLNAQIAIQNMNKNVALETFNAAEANKVNIVNAQLDTQIAGLNTEIEFEQSKLATLNDQFNAAEANRVAAINAGNDLQVQTINAQIDQFNQEIQAATDRLNAVEANKVELSNSLAATQVSLSNAQQETAISQFNTELENSREIFNAQAQQIIEQSNVAWRRAVNTANTAELNAAIQTDVENLYNLSSFALSSLWQQFRDEAFWSFQSGENELDRAANLAIAALERQTAFDLQDDEQTADLFRLIGAFTFNVLDGIGGDGE